MPTREEVLHEAAKRGLLGPEQKAAYDEAIKRGIIASPTGESGADFTQQEAALKVPAWKQTVSGIARPVLEATGATAGGIIGAGAGAGVASPVTAVAGGALGYAAGSRAADVLDVVLGVRKPKTFGQEIARGAEQVTEGLETEALGLGVGAAASKTLKALEPVGARAKQFIEAKVRPTVGTLTGSPGAQRMEEMLANTVGGSKVMQDAAKKSLSDLEASLKTAAAKYGPEMTTEQAGEVIKKGSAGAAKRFTSQAEKLYGQLDRHIPADNPVALDKTLSYLDGKIAQYENTPALQKRFVGGLKALRDDIAADLEIGKGFVEYDVMKRLRSDVGSRISGLRGNVTDTIEAGDYKRLYRALSEDMKIAAQESGPDAMRAWTRADKYYRMNQNLTVDTLEDIVGKDTSQKVFDYAMEGSQKTGEKINRVLRNLKPAERPAVASALLEKMGRATPGNQNAAGTEWSVNTFLTNWNKISPKAKDVIFGSNKTQLRQGLDKVVQIAEMVKDPSKIINASKTGSSLMSYVSLMTPFVGYQMGGLEGAAGAAATNILAPNIAAKLMTNPKFVQWLGTAGQSIGKMSPQSKAQIAATAHAFGRLVKIASEEPEIAPDIQAYMTAMSVGNSQAGVKTP